MNKLIIIILTLIQFSTLQALGQISGGNEKIKCTEEIKLTTDREVYLSGETLWFKVYLIYTNSDNAVKSKIAYLEILDSNLTPIKQLKVKIEDDIGYGAIYLPLDVQTGQYTISVYTSWMKNFGHNSFCNKKIAVINSFNKIDSLPTVSNNHTVNYANSTEIICDKSRYNQRDGVVVKIKNNNGDTLNSPATYSLKVYRVDALDTTGSLYLDVAGKSSQYTVNNKSILYPPEIYAPILMGKVVSKSTGIPLANQDIYISVPGRIPRFYVTRSNRNGQIFAEMTKYYGDGEIIIQPATGNPDVVININSPFYSRHQEFDRAPWTPTNARLINTLKARHRNLQISKAYSPMGPEKVNIPKEALDSLPFFGTYDEQFNLDDYTRFTTMEEVFREYVRTVMVRNWKDTLHLLALNNAKASPGFFNSDPLVLIDGVPIKNNKKFFAFDPLKLRKGTVMARPYFYNTSVSMGVVYLQTYKGDLAGFPLDNYVTIMDYNGIQYPKKFYSPDYSMQNNIRIPDNRELLYWNAIVKDGQDVEFYTSDLKGEYKIIVEGYSKNGDYTKSIKSIYVN
ncbi:hypothetical protein COR50_18420 [Chitinophaga caeni]|uniref:Macroglobulin domain-containing protein n=1 Tax=Chitinophaga caeni TaxID=2029983 RepID=A0A291QYD9_9BACT|nr:hypothetical protein [Chitinophaga caeni]ATL48986.1 hypothetical protein COR50_18420 [Chitinophaga caeni]